MELPKLPAPIDQFLYRTKQCQTQEEIRNVTEPYMRHESKLREVFSQQPDHPAVSQNHLVPVFAAKSPQITVRARNLEKESNAVKDHYLLALPDDQRKPNGAPATVADFATFKTNFNLFSESSLADLDWTNVVACGSAAVTALLPVDAPHNESKRALRAYYHEILAPASDVDLFLYGLNEEQAIEKIRQIETSVRDSILSETTTIRTKNAITICSEYPTRHVQIVLRLYKSVSEILTGFDVDSSCVAYDGSQVWASPRALAAFMTQVNTVDLTRRSPSYENRLSKYSHRGFEACWPALDRDRVDPTIYERSFGRVLGLARLLVLEKLPHPSDRDSYLAKRRQERGRPELTWNARYRHQLQGNVKDAQPDDVAEWVEEEDASSYHTFTVPYGPKYNAKRIERLLFTKDLLLNAEWNRPKDRETNLHRHPAFFGRAQDVLDDCCGYCPTPDTDEDLAVAEQECKIYISGKVEFQKDDPGRQAIGSFHPLTDDDWTEMAYIGNTARLCQAIVDKDLEGVADWFESGDLEQVDVNRRDHAGRTPLQLAAMCSTPEIVEFLIERGARIVSRIYSGMTALHISAFRGETEMVKALLDKSSANEEEEDEKEESRRETRRAAARGSKADEGNDQPDADKSDSDEIGDLDEEDDESLDDVTEGSFVKVSDKDNGILVEDDEDEPDVYDVDVLAWDNPFSPLHLAIIGGRIDVIKLLCEEYSADILLPVKILSSYDRTPESAILAVLLAIQLPLAEAKRTISAVLAQGGSAIQADMKSISALYYAVNEAKPVILDALRRASDTTSLAKAMNFLVTDAGRYRWYNKTVNYPLLTAIQTRRPEIVDAVLEMGAEPEISLEAYSEAYHRTESHPSADPEDVKMTYKENVDQPVIVAARMEMPEVVSRLIDLGADVNTCPKDAYQFMRGYTWRQENKSLLDVVQDRIKDLRESIAEKASDNSEAPQKLATDDQYLNYDPTSYKGWFASHELAQAKYVKQCQLKAYEDDMKAIELTPVEGKLQKKEAIEAVITSFELLERKMKGKGAKSFRGVFQRFLSFLVLLAQWKSVRFLSRTLLQLFPGAPTQDSGNHVYGGGRHDESGRKEPFTVEFNFSNATVTDRNKNSYVQLFEAAWCADIDTVKELCLRKEAPLQVAVQDVAGFSPFSLALIRGHRDLASAVLEIATAQYKPADKEPVYRYRLRDAQDEDSCSDDSVDSDSENDPILLKQVVDDKFTVDDVTALADNVKSKVSPLTMLGWNAELWRAQKDSPQEKDVPVRPSSFHVWRHQKSSWQWFHDALATTRSSCRESLISRAIARNDLPLLQFILRAGMDLMKRKAEEDDSKIYQIGTAEFESAVRFGHTDMIGAIIAATGASVPLQKMAQSSGVVLNEVPKYYQGLSVYGKKRADWAERDAPRRHKAAENDNSPILRAILKGNLKSVEYFLSDAPLNRYLEFAKTFHDDERIQSLAKADGGIEKALANWLGTRLDLSAHMAVMAPSGRDGKTPLLDYILRAMPDALDVKSKAEGKTPLQLAFELNKLSAAQTLIQAGANQATRNHLGENLLHTILTNSNLANQLLLDRVFKLMDPKLIQPLLLEKCSSPEPGSLTPLALYLHSHGEESVVKMILDQSQGKDLEILNGAGDYILHDLVKKRNEALVKFFVEYRPEMLYWENATGMTAIDVAEIQYLRSVIESPPTLRTATSYSIKDLPDGHFAPKEAEKSKHEEQIEELLDVSEEDLKEKGAAWRMDRLLKKLAEKYPGKRRLVSVIEANEVARRLAGEQKKKNAETKRRERLGLNAGRGYHIGSGTERDGYGNEKATKGQDEVSMWKGESCSNGAWDMVVWELRIRRENGEEVDEKTKLKVCQKWNVPFSELDQA